MNDTIGVNISERRSGIERTKKRELVFVSTARGGATGTAVRRLDVTRILPEPQYPGPYAARTKSQLNKQAKHTKFYNFAERISFAEHWKLVAESSEFHLMLSRAHRAHFPQLKMRKKKRDILSEKRERWMALKKREFTPESGNVDTYVTHSLDLLGVT